MTYSIAQEPIYVTNKIGKGVFVKNEIAIAATINIKSKKYKCNLVVHA